MAYTVLARKYRPQKFADLVGQEHVTRTLGNAIAAGRVAHAFLFTGARGVGKTSTARLLAKALNCEQGPTATPCNACDPCVEITAGTDLDVLEIDGASNNSVEDVRRLQESLPYRPSRDRHKVVIVDEVHMLSTGAFNAFLKTLEEPPAHVKFIFATTENHKVPITIRSRCQRHDFRLIPQPVVEAHVRHILEQEGIESDARGVSIVAREAAGSMRDALTVLDQVLAFGDGRVSGDEVVRGLGIADQAHVWTVAQALLQGEPTACLKTVHDLGNQGVDVLHFARQLVSLSRDLVVVKVAGDDPVLVELAAEDRERAVALVADHSAAELERTFAGLSELVDAVGQSGQPRLTLEMGLVRLADRPRLQELSTLIEKLDALAAGQAPSSDDPGPAGGPRGPGGAGGPRGAGGAAGSDRAGATTGPARQSRRPPAGPGPGQRADGERQGIGRPAPPSERPAVDDDRGPRPAGPASGTGLGPGLGPGPASAPQPAVAAAAPVSAPTAAPAQSGGAMAPPPSPATARDAGASSPASPAPEHGSQQDPPAREHGSQQDPPAEAGADASELPPAWAELVRSVKERQPALGAILEHGVGLVCDAQRVRVAFPKGSFFGRQAKSKGAQRIVIEVAEGLFGGTPVFEVVVEGAGQGVTVAKAEADALSRQREEARAAALNHPRVKEVLEVFPEARDDVDVRTELE